MLDTNVARELFFHWFQHTYGHEPSVIESTDTTVLADVGGMRLTVEVRALLSFDASEAWDAARADLESRIAEIVPASIAVWTPLGANLPSDEPAASEFVDTISTAAIKLGPRERSHARLPIELYLRKSDASGGVVSVTGGLNAHWARFTEHVQGSYDLDASRLHRLPESDEHLEELLGGIIDLSRTLDVKQVGTFETYDAWTVQRIGDERSARIVGVPPSATEDIGLQIRRNLRRTLADGAPRLRDADTDVRAMVVLGYYARMEDEVVTNALRGFDPALYSGIDVICLVADGLVKPLIQAPASALTASR